MRKIVLASSSPRRRALLKQIGLPCIADASNVDEVIDKRLTPAVLAKQLSQAKAKAVAKRHKNALIISADTLVVFQRKILGKPITRKTAEAMLRMLQGKKHVVITAFTILDSASGKSTTKAIETKVYMKTMAKQEIDSYVATDEPLDKAGGYASQERGAIFIKRIDGDFFNVVGLPLAALVDELAKFDVKIP